MTKLEILLAVTPHRGRGSSGSGRTSFCTGRLIASDDWLDLNRKTPRWRYGRFVSETREGTWKSLFMASRKSEMTEEISVVLDVLVWSGELLSMKEMNMSAAYGAKQTRRAGQSEPEEL